MTNTQTITNEQELIRYLVQEALFPKVEFSRKLHASIEAISGMVLASKGAAKVDASDEQDIKIKVS